MRSAADVHVEADQNDPPRPEHQRHPERLKPAVPPVPQRPDLVATAIKPDYALGPHTASLGLAFYEGDLLPRRYRGGAFVAQHGSWDRKPLSGYRVIFVPFANGRPAGAAEEVLGGFVDDDEKAHGRPVGVAVDARGAVLVADDVGNTIWRLGPESSTQVSER